jgi:hypothetical protein
MNSPNSRLGTIVFASFSVPTFVVFLAKGLVPIYFLECVLQCLFKETRKSEIRDCSAFRVVQLRSRTSNTSDHPYYAREPHRPSMDARRTSFNN